MKGKLLPLSFDIVITFCTGQKYQFKPVSKSRGGSLSLSYGYTDKHSDGGHSSVSSQIVFMAVRKEVFPKPGRFSSSFSTHSQYPF